MDNIAANTYNAPTPPPKKNFLGIKLTPKIIFIILGIVVLVEVFIAVRSLTSPVATPPSQVNNSIQPAQGVAKISLKISSTSFKVGEEIPVTVLVDTVGRLISGIDLILQYDPKALSITDKDIIKSNLFDDYPIALADSDKGIITISGISNSQNGIAVAGQFVVINFKAKALGKTSLTIDFQKGTTTHSNLVEASTVLNILEQVDNLEINIQ